MGATVLESCSEWRAQTRDLMKRSELNAEVLGEASRDMEELVSSFRTVKKRRACPAGSPPAELWTMLLHASRNLSPGRKKIEPVFTLSLVEMLMCRFRSSGTAPLAWHRCVRATRRAQGKESGARVVLQSSIEDEEGHVVATCARRMGAWIHPGKAASLSGKSRHDSG